MVMEMINAEELPYKEEPKVNFFLYPPMKASPDGISSIGEKLDLHKNMEYDSIFTLYISVPYCRKRCNSCNCFRGFLPGQGDNNAFLDQYVDTLIDQMKAYSNTRRFSEATCAAVYIGGGTGSVLSPAQIKRLVEEVKKSFTTLEQFEINLEGNPVDFTKDYLKQVKEYGINRLSIGYQSGQDAVLDALNTSHRSVVGKQAIYDAIDTRFECVNIDLLYNVPGQTFEMWKADVNEVVELFQPQNISVGDYMVYKGSRADELIQKGLFQKQWGIDEVNRWYQWTCERLGQDEYREFVRGILAKPGKDQKYVQYSCSEGSEILGLGAGAFAYINGYQFRNVFQSEKYKKCIREKNYFAADQISGTPSKLYKMQRFAIHNLYTEVIDMDKFYKRFNISAQDVFNTTIEKLVHYKLVNMNHERIWLTNLGKKWRRSVYYEFYDEQFKD
jgi:oxygen-independent coproporphyrinogen-3 oxidase